MRVPPPWFCPETDRYQILEVIDEDHWIPLDHDKPGSYTLTKESVGSRYAFAFVRTQVNVQDPAGCESGRRAGSDCLQQAEKGSFVSPKRYEMQEILALRADYNAAPGA